MTLWLDDVRDPQKHGHIGADWVKTADDAIAAIQTGRYDFASLDHDLSEAATMGCAGPKEKTGYTVVCWLEQNPQFWPEDGIAVHSMNPVGATKMRTVIHAHYRRRFDPIQRCEMQRDMAEQDRLARLKSL